MIGLRLKTSRQYLHLMPLMMDLLSIPLAWLGAYWIRNNLKALPPHVWQQALHALLPLFAIQTLLYWRLHLNRATWYFTSFSDLIRIIKCVILGCLFGITSIYLLRHLQSFPRSIFPLYGLLFTALLVTPRALSRYFYEGKKKCTGEIRTLVIGAGQGGEALMRNLLKLGNREYQPVAFLDDDPQKYGREIHGIRVAGTIQDIERIARQFRASTAIIAIPSGNPALMRRIVQSCKEAKLDFRTLPSLSDIISNESTITNLRPLSLEDLLGRDPVTLNWSSIQKHISGKNILVTGGGGSIGSELCKQICTLSPARLIIMDNSEFNLYTINQELREQFPNLDIISCLNDITDLPSSGDILIKYKPNIVFHAAAYKHVPLLENQIRTAIRNNLIGTYDFAALTARHGIETFVLISSDKAVNPSNIMGATKRAAEYACQVLQKKSDTRFITVRFGNVLGSRGSVVPLFQKQISAGGPITITHPDMERYFMTIKEASQLILEATSIGSKGEIFILDMGKPIKILDLAEQMIQLASSPTDKIGIVYTGLRPGEKIQEELFYNFEQLTTTSHPKILKSTHSFRIGDGDVLEEIKNTYLNNNDPKILMEKLTLLIEISKKNRAVTR